MTPVQAQSVAGLMKRIRTEAKLSARDVARATGADFRTVQRWSAGTFQPYGPRYEAVLALDTLVTRLRKKMNPTDTRAWLFSPHPKLHDALPIDFFRDGSQQVLKVA